MRILALIKYSYDVAEIFVDPATHQMRLEGVPRTIGNVDRTVVEAGVQLKEKFGGNVHVLMFGPTHARDSFKDVLAMGVDEGYLIEDITEGRMSVAGAVRVLERAVRSLERYDLILCGFASDDGYAYQVGPRLAERLNLPIVSYARALDIQDTVLHADRDLEHAVQQVQVPLPCIVSIAEEAFHPRRITLMDAIRAKKKPVHVWTVADHLDLQAVYANAALVDTGQHVGIVVERKQIMLSGQDAAARADALLDALVHENILREGSI